MIASSTVRHTVKILGVMSKIHSDIMHTIFTGGMRMYKSALTLSALLLTACSTTLVPPNEARQATQDRLFKYQETKPGLSKVTIIRDSGMIGGGCFATVFLNGEPAAKLDPKEKATFYLTPGEWAIGASAEGKGLCNYGGQRQERYINIPPHEERYLRIFTSDGGDMDIRPTTIK